MTDSAPPAVASSTDQAVLYRPAALEHRRLGGVDMRPSDVAPPWAWAVTIGIAASLFVAGLFVAFADVELSTQGRAILYPGTGVRTVRSEVPAVATEVATEPGKTVTSGEILIYLASAESEAAVSERQSELTILQRDRSQFTAIEQRSYNAVERHRAAYPANGDPAGEPHAVARNATRARRRQRPPRCSRSGRLFVRSGES